MSTALVILSTTYVCVFLGDLDRSTKLTLYRFETEFVAKSCAHVCGAEISNLHMVPLISTS